MSSPTSRQRTEVIVFCSGKGGTGKTSLISALGYALRASKHEVLFVDADRATDGLSLFLLGPEGREQLAKFEASNTFTGLLEEHERTGSMSPSPYEVFRTQDHGLSYDVIISDRYLYGDDPASGPSASASIDRQFQRPAFQRAVQALFESIRAQAHYDYVLVDSRGGFSFESTDVAAAGDSFIVVTEATFTNFHQDRNLVNRISDAAVSMNRRAVLRGVIVNKSTEPGEASYRNELVREFGIRFEDTYTVSIDLDALRAYKQQQSVFKVAPASKFAYDALQAYQRILQVVTSRWSAEHVALWDQLIATIDEAIARNNAQVEAARLAQQEEADRMVQTAAERDQLRAELERTREAQAQEQRRQDILLEELRGQDTKREARFARELEEARSRIKQEAAVARELDSLKASHEAEREISRARQSARTSALLLVFLMVFVAALAGWYAWSNRPRESAATGSPSGASYPTPVASLPAASPASAPVESAPVVADGPVATMASTPQESASQWLKPCFAGTYNVVVASSLRDARAAELRRAELARNYPDLEFEVMTSVSGDRSSNVMQAIFAGHGLSRSTANSLLQQIRGETTVKDAFITFQPFDCIDGMRGTNHVAPPTRRRSPVPQPASSGDKKYGS